jgi:hypothetical protein
MASHGGAPMEERGDRTGPRRRARCLGLGFTSCAAPRGCRGTCSTVRGSSERGCHRAPPNWETGEGDITLSDGRTLMSSCWSGHWAKGTWCGRHGLAEESIERGIGQGSLNTCAHTRHSWKCHLHARSRKVAGEAERRVMEQRGELEHA